MSVMDIGSFMRDPYGNILMIIKYSPRTNTYSIQYQKPGIQIKLDHISESELADCWTFMTQEEVKLWRTLYGE